METLKFLLQGKKADKDTPREVVREAAEWLRIQFENAKVPNQQVEEGYGFGAYSHFQVQSQLASIAITLHVKIAEINGEAYAFAEVCVRGHQEEILFPFFGEISTADGKLTILHYIADFILSTTPES